MSTRNLKQPLRLCVRTSFLSVFLCISLWAAGLPAEIVDRVALVVGKTVFTESEILDAVLLTEFLNDEPLDTSAAKRRSAAEHLIDQELLRNEIKVTGFLPPAPSEADQLLQQLIRRRFHGEAEYRAALQPYGVAEDQLKQQLLWQLTLVRFTDFRFRTEAPAPPSTTGTAERAVSDSVDQRLDAFLKDARANTKIVVKPEAFQ